MTLPGRTHTRRLVTLGAAAVAAVAVVVTLAVPGLASARAQSRPSDSRDYVTFYGFVDNSPPGRAIAHPGCRNGGHRLAAGIGTFRDPVSFAQVGANGPWCQVIYVPFLKKYFIHEDQCAGSCGGVPKNHVDLWMGGDRRSLHNPGKAALLNCENKWTRGPGLAHRVTVIHSPPRTLPVDKTPLFTPPKTCHGGTGD